MTQYLYLISCKNNWQTFYKVGIANDVESRLAQLQTGNPLELSIEECYQFDNAEIVERAIHQAWKKERVRGEWFELGGDGVEKFQEVCQALGGDVYVPESYDPDDSMVEEAEEMQEGLNDGARWDFTQMFKDGWRIEKSTSKGVNNRYWCWRKGAESIGRKYIYGGVIDALPYPIDEMKKRFCQ